MESDSSGGASASLLSKYTILTDAISTTRDNIAKIQLDITEMESRMMANKSHHTRIERNLQIRREELGKFSALLCDSTNADDDQSFLQTEKDKIFSVFQQQAQREVKLELLRNLISSSEIHRKSTRMKFIHDCKEFRMVSRDLRNQVATEQLNKAGLHIDGPENSGSLSQLHTSVNGKDTLTYEEKLKRVQEKVQQSTDEKLSLLNSLTNIRSRRQSFKKRDMERKKNLAQQLGQLDRVRRDVSVMTADVNEVERETREILQINDGHSEEYETRKKRNWTQHCNSEYASSPQYLSNGKTVTPSPFGYNNSNKKSKKVEVRNPYMKPSTRIPYSESGLDTDIRFEESSLKRQHPHRAGRIRIDRQFTTAISIRCASNGDVFDGGSKGEPERKRNVIKEIPNSISLDEKSDSECHLSLRNTRTENENKKSDHDGGEDAHSVSTDGDDSAEDDDLLLFVPFKGPSM